MTSFLNENHLHGYIDSKMKIGLFYNNELVSLMVFNKYSDGYEILRFCNKINNIVVGGASKIFKHFLKKYNPLEIKTYVDRSISQGELDLKLILKQNPIVFLLKIKLGKKKKT